MAGFEDIFQSVLNMGNAAVTSPLAGVLGVKSPTAQAGEESKIAGALNPSGDVVLPGGAGTVSPLVIGGAVVVLILVVVLIRGRK